MHYSVCDLSYLFKKKFTLSSIFNYYVTESEQAFDFDFQQSPNTSLLGIENVNVGDIIAETNIETCQQCEVQAETLRAFYASLDMEFYFEGHECEHLGIN